MSESFVFLRVLPALLSILALGGGLVWLLWRNDEQPKLAEWFGWSWTLGSGGIAFLVALFGLVVSGSALVFAVTSVCIGIAVAGFAKQRRWNGTILWLWQPGVPNWEKLVALAGCLLVIQRGCGC